MKSDLTCYLMIVLGLWAITARSVGAQQQPDSGGWSLGIATSQNGAPVGLRGYLASVGTFLYETAKVENLSPKQISVVSFGVLVADPQNRRVPILLRSATFDVSLSPGKIQDVDVRLLRLSQLEDLRRSLSGTPRVTLGVIAVEWADGTSWVFDLPEGATDFSSGTGRVLLPKQM